MNSNLLCRWSSKISTAVFTLILVGVSIILGGYLFDSYGIHYGPNFAQKLGFLLMFIGFIVGVILHLLCPSKLRNDEVPELQVEWKYYHEIKKDLLVHSENKYVLIKNREVLGIFDSQMEAYNFGLDKLGYVPMLIQQILEEDPIIYIY